MAMLNTSTVAQHSWEAFTSSHVMDDGSTLVSIFQLTRSELDQTHQSIMRKSGPAAPTAM